MQMLIWKTLYSLGVGPRMKGFFYSVRAVEFILDSEKIPKNLVPVYQEVAKHYNVEVGNVTDRIRVAAQKAWKVDRRLLEKMAGYTLPKPPGAASFVQILADNLRKELDKPATSYGDIPLNNELDNYGILTERMSDDEPRYNFRAIREYCSANNKTIAEMTQEEKDMLISE